MITEYVEDGYVFRLGVASDYNATDITNILNKLKLAMNVMNSTIDVDILKINLDVVVKEILSNRQQVLGVYKDSKLVAAFSYNIISSVTHAGRVPCFTSNTVWTSTDITAHELFVAFQRVLAKMDVYCVKIVDARKGFVEVFDATKTQAGTSVHELTTSDVMIYFDKNDENKRDFIIRR
jgi:hypothetical protein